jgi:hypothetical protein
MQVAKLTQDYYGLFRQSAAPGKESEARRLRPSVLPTERVVEGELLRNRAKRPGDSLDDAMHRGRFSAGSAHSQDKTISSLAAQRAINAYLDYAAAPNLSQGGQARAVDYYA